jgi:hypothetical protein
MLKYENDKLFPFPGMKNPEEQGNRERARGFLAAASASTPNVSPFAVANVDEFNPHPLPNPSHRLHQALNSVATTIATTSRAAAGGVNSDREDAGTPMNGSAAPRQQQQQHIAFSSFGYRSGLGRPVKNGAPPPDTQGKEGSAVVADR